MTNLVNKKEFREKKEKEREERLKQKIENENNIRYYKTISFPVYNDDWPTVEVSYTKHKNLRF